MSLIETIKKDMKDQGNVRSVSWSYCHFLVEYYEAHQNLISIKLLRAIFRRQGSKKGIERLRRAHKRFQKARIALERK